MYSNPNPPKHKGAYHIPGPSPQCWTRWCPQNDLSDFTGVVVAYVQTFDTSKAVLSYGECWTHGFRIIQSQQTLSPARFWTLLHIHHHRGRRTHMAQHLTEQRTHFREETINKVQMIFPVQNMLNPIGFETIDLKIS